MNEHRFKYEWTLTDLKNKKVGEFFHGARVFSCFAGGGGSSMGYKLAGYNVIGGCEIDSKMAASYERNLHPTFMFKDDIRKLVNGLIQKELEDLDILDGSPPCTLFSRARMNSERNRGKEKVFREGQQKQILDDLFFYFIDLAAKLQPKIVIAENVQGMLIGSAKKYIGRIVTAMDKAGYFLSIHKINGADMGLPQARLRLFFLAIRKDLIKNTGIKCTGMINLEPSIDMIFNEKHVPFKNVMDITKRISVKSIIKGKPQILKFIREHYFEIKPGRSYADIHPNPKRSYFNDVLLHPNMPIPTIGTLAHLTHLHPVEMRGLNELEVALCCSFPLDYDYTDNDAYYVNAMSVPPIMMAHVAARVKEQWLDKIKGVINENQQTAIPRIARSSTPGAGQQRDC